MRGRLGRNVIYAWQRWLLRRQHLLATGLPLDMQLRFRAPDDVGRRIFKRGVHEPHILDRLLAAQDRLRGGLLIDAGANLGWYAVLLHRLDGARVIAFEPDPENLGLLHDNLALNGADAVEVVACALSDRPGTAVLHRYRDINLGRHSLRPDGRAAGQLEVSVSTLDQCLAGLGADAGRVAFMKVDVEGHEPALLRGATATLKRLDMLAMEFSPMYYTRAETRSMLCALEAAGLTPEAWLENRWRALSGDELLAQQGQCDTLWTRR